MIQEGVLRGLFLVGWPVRGLFEISGAKKRKFPGILEDARYLA